MIKQISANLNLKKECVLKTVLLNVYLLRVANVQAGTSSDSAAFECDIMSFPFS